MNLHKLSPRIRAIVDEVPVCGAVADIGCDHGLVAIALVLSGRAERVYASDIRESPLERARLNIARAGLCDRIYPVLCDGLKEIPPCDAVVIAGLSGDTIAEILSGADAACGGERVFILQPMTRAERLRSFLYENGYRIEKEVFAREGEKLYVIFRAVYGKSRIKDVSEIVVSRAAESAPLFLDYLDREIARVQTRIRGRALAKTPDKKSLEKDETLYFLLLKRRKLYAESFRDTKLS